MARHDLVGRLRRVERGMEPSGGVHVWYLADEEHDDGRVLHIRTGEMVARAEVDRRPGRHILVEYVDGAAPCA